MTQQTATAKQTSRNIDEFHIVKAFMDNTQAIHIIAKEPRTEKGRRNGINGYMSKNDNNQTRPLKIETRNKNNPKHYEKGSRLHKQEDTMAAVYTFERLKELIIPFMKHYADIERAYIFGSYARGEADERSDVDVHIDADKLKNLDLCELMVLLERALGIPVDVIPTDSIPENFLNILKEHEVLIYER